RGAEQLGPGPLGLPGAAVDRRPLRVIRAGLAAGGGESGGQRARSGGERDEEQAAGGHAPTVVCPPNGPSRSAFADLAPDGHRADPVRRAPPRQLLSAMAITLEAGNLRATFAPEAGLVCCSLRDGDDELLGLRGGLEAWRERGKTMGIPFLHPWANRLDEPGF